MTKKYLPPALLDCLGKTHSSGIFTIHFEASFLNAEPPCDWRLKACLDFGGDKPVVVKFHQWSGSRMLGPSRLLWPYDDFFSWEPRCSEQFLAAANSHCLYCSALLYCFALVRVCLLCYSQGLSALQVCSSLTMFGLPWLIMLCSTYTALLCLFSCYAPTIFALLLLFWTDLALGSRCSKYWSRCSEYLLSFPYYMLAAASILMLGIVP